LNPNFGMPPSAISVDATDWAFAMAEFNSTTGQDFSASTPVPDHDPTFSSSYVDNVYGILIAADWVITSPATLTCATTTNAASQRTIISFATV
jgi:hypothetical protein